MDNKHLTVTISGPCASGKTTLALALFDFLQARGFKHVTLDDIDLGDSPEQAASSLRKHQNERMEAHIERQISIETVQTRHQMRAAGSCVHKGCDRLTEAGKHACREHAARDNGEPKTRLVTHVDPRNCIPYGGVGAFATEYVADDKTRTPLKG